MRRLVPLLLLALPAASGWADSPPALAQLAGAVARDVGEPPAGRRSLFLVVEARGTLGPAVETALSAALAGRGYAVTPRRGAADAERDARAAGQDWLLRVRAGLVPGRRELAIVGELIPTWRSFFFQRTPDVRPIPPRIVEARAAADASTLLLARETRAPAAPFVRIRELARVPGRVIALAAGRLDDAGRTVIVAVTKDAVTVLGPEGSPIATRFEEAAPGPPREPAASVAIGDFGGGRIALRRAGAPLGEVLTLRGDRLETAGSLEAAPLCAGEAGRLFGAFAPGTSVLEDSISPLVDPAARPRSARRLYGIAAAPRGGPIAFAVLGTDLGLELLGPDLSPVVTAARGTSAGPAAIPTSTSVPTAPPSSRVVRPGERSGASAPSSTRATNYDDTSSPALAPGARREAEGVVPPATDAARARTPITGSGFALADLDGDGLAELVASSPDPRAPERIRVLAPLASAPLLFESGPVDGVILAGAAADLTGDGVDDAVLASIHGEGGAAYTELLLLTADPGEAP